MKTPANNTTSPKEEKRFQRAGRWISSVVIAIIIWVVVVNVVNPEVTETRKDIPITFVGESYLRDKGFVIVNRDAIPPFSLKVRGTRRDLMNGMKHISVQAEVSDIEKKGTVTVPVQINISDRLSVQKQKFSTVELTVEPRYDKTVPVRVEQLGDGEQKIAGRIVSSVPEVDEIQISGSVADVENVKECVVTVDVSTLTSSGRAVQGFRFIDKEGKPLDENSSVYCSSNLIGINNTVYERHTLETAVEVNALLRREFLVQFEERDINVTSVDVGVSEGTDVPDKLVAVIPGGDYESGTHTVHPEIKEIEGVYIPETEITVKAEFIPMQTKKTQIKIKLKNLPENLTGDELTVEKTLLIPEGMSGEVTATVDCEDFTAGENKGRIKPDSKSVLFDNPDDNTVSVILREKQIEN